MAAPNTRPSSPPSTASPLKAAPSSSPPAATASRSSSTNPTSPSAAPPPTPLKPSSSTTPAREPAARKPATPPSTSSATTSTPKTSPSRTTSTAPTSRPRQARRPRPSTSKATATSSTNVRILGNQDTLYIGAKRCGQAGNLRSPAPATGVAPGTATPAGAPTAYAPTAAPCTPLPTRSYFTHCVIAGNVDFIYGDGNAVFDDCEIHSTLHDAGGYLTAQGKFRPDQDSAFVFNHCRLTAEPGQANVWLARPWRPYATVIYMNTEMGAHILPAGWREWHPGDTHYLDTVYYAEYKSTGPGANPAARVPQSHQLTAAEAKKYETATFLAGSDHWNPEAAAKAMK